MGRDSKKMCAILPLRGILPSQTQICLMHEGRTLQGVIASFLAKVVVGQPTQFVVHQRHQRLKCFAVSLPPANEQLRDRTGRFSMQGWIPRALGGERCVRDRIAFLRSQVNKLKIQEL